MARYSSRDYSPGSETREASIWVGRRRSIGAGTLAKRLELVEAATEVGLTVPR